jgi:HK97 family phage prohead protease
MPPHDFALTTASLASAPQPSWSALATPPFRRILVYPLQIKSAADQAFEGWASTPAVDRQGEVVLPEALAASLPDYMRNPIVTYAHDWLHPIGRTTEARATEAGLHVRILLGRTTRAREIWQLIEDRILRSLSIGFNAGPEDGYERDGIWHWRRIELLEISIVPIPANPQATITIARQLGLDLGPLFSLHLKAATPFVNLPLAPEDTPWRWDVQAQNEVLGQPPNWERYRQAHFWWDTARPHSKSSYKLPFAKMVGGELRAVWRGVAAAMAALLGARGGVDLPASDRWPVYQHICRYYEKFGKTPPRFHAAEPSSSMPGTSPLLSPWPASLRQVQFHHGELEIFAEGQLLSAAEEIERLALDACKLARHCAKQGRPLPVEAVAALRKARHALMRLVEKGTQTGAAPSSAEGPALPPPASSAALADALLAALVRRLDPDTLLALLHTPPPD